MVTQETVFHSDQVCRQILFRLNRAKKKNILTVFNLKETFQYHGRPCITNAQQDRYICIFRLRNRTITSTQTASSMHGFRRISA